MPISPSYSFAIPYARDQSYVSLTSCGYTNSEYRDLDYAGALNFVQSPILREWLIWQACEKLTELDEAGLPKLAAKLKGKERDIVLGNIASLMLQRGDPRAADALNQLNGDLENVPGLDKIALRDPRPLLERFAGPDDSGAQRLWGEWAMNDAPAALEWLQGQDERKRRTFVERSTDGTVERLAKSTAELKPPKVLHRCIISNPEPRWILRRNCRPARSATARSAHFVKLWLTPKSRLKRENCCL